MRLSKNHRKYMSLALALAKRAEPFPNPRVGAVLVKDGKIIGTGYHRKAGMPHAEILAMEDGKTRARSKKNLKGPPLSGSTLYVSLEPCSHEMKRTPPCTKAIIREGIGEVVFAMKDPNPLVSGNGTKALKAAGIIVRGPAARIKAEKINKKYLDSIEKPPFVAIKMAMSADGKSACRGGDSKWISCPQSRALVHRMRSEFDAVMVGAGTVRKDDPELTAHGMGRTPHRVVVDGPLSIPLQSRLVKNPDKKTIVAITSRALHIPGNKSKIKKLESLGARVFVSGSGRFIDLRALVLGLSAMGLKKILIEGGNELNSSALEAKIVDRLCLFIAPKIIGGKDALPVIGGKGIAKMKDAIPLKNMKIRKIGSDFLLEADVGKRKGWLSRRSRSGISDRSCPAP